MVKFRQMWIDLRTSFWFAPSLMVLVAIGVALMLVQIEVSPRLEQRWPRVFAIEAEAARELLSTIGTAMLSVAGVTFSVMLVALSLASSQFSTRILRMFMRSRTTHVALGALSGIFAYCLVVLYSIRSGDGADGVPGVAVFGAFLLAIAGVGVLIVFIHHVATSIQVVNILSSLSTETVATIDMIYPDRLTSAVLTGAGTGLAPDPHPEPDSDRSRHADLKADPDPQPEVWRTVRALESGYVETVDIDALFHCACACGRLVRMDVGIGDFAVEAAPLLSVAGTDPVSPDIAVALRQSYTLSQYRTAEQDPGFGIREIVDIALKALSPAVNDTTTALTCIDYLSVILARVAPRTIPASRRLAQGELRLLVRGPGFDTYVRGAFDEIRWSAGGNAVVLSQILHAIGVIARLTSAAQRLRVLEAQVERIEEQAARKVESPAARAQVASAIAQARAACADDRAGQCLPDLLL